jgi:hypothetical protein
VGGMISPRAAVYPYFLGQLLDPEGEGLCESRTIREMFTQQLSVGSEGTLCSDYVVTSTFFYMHLTIKFLFQSNRNLFISFRLKK